MVQTDRPVEPVEAPAEPSTPTRRRGSGGPAARVRAVVVLVAVVAGALLLVRLGAQERGGPPHSDVTLPNGIPATVYVPGEVDDDFQDLPDPAPVGQRPPVVALGHGFSADRVLMSTLARSLTAAGYAVVAFDFQGHGSNPHRFGSTDLRADVRAVVDWIEDQPYWDPSRLAVMGHSMGAGAVLDFATVDARPDVVVPISGGWNVDGPEVPKHVFLILAEDDPSGLHDRVENAEDRLGRAGAKVERSVVANTDHATILWSGVAVERIVAWMDDAFGIERDAPATRADGRLGTTGLYFLCVLVVIAAIGVGAARLAPTMATRPFGRAAGAGLAVFAGALLVTMPLLSTATPTTFVPLEVGDVQAAQLFATGALVLALGVAVRRGSLSWLDPAWLGGTDRTVRDDVRGLALPVAAAVIALYLVITPFGAVYHRLALTPARLLAGAIMAVLVFPFWLAAERLTRRGGTVQATLMGVATKVVLLIVTMIGVNLEVLPGVIAVIVPVLVLIFVLFEVFAAAAYAAGRNIALIAAVQAIWMAWFAAATMPIRL